VQCFPNGILTLISTRVLDPEQNRYAHSGWCNVGTLKGEMFNNPINSTLCLIWHVGNVLDCGSPPCHQEPNMRFSLWYDELQKKLHHKLAYGRLMENPLTLPKIQHPPPTDPPCDLSNMAPTPRIGIASAESWLSQLPKKGVRRLHTVQSSGRDRVPEIANQTAVV
jgi:hypothetical protein